MEEDKRCSGAEDATALEKCDGGAGERGADEATMSFEKMIRLHLLSQPGPIPRSAAAAVGEETKGREFTFYSAKKSVIDAYKSSCLSRNFLFDADSWRAASLQCEAIVCLRRALREMCSFGETLLNIQASEEEKVRAYVWVLSVGIRRPELLYWHVELVLEAARNSLCGPCVLDKPLFALKTLSLLQKILHWVERSQIEDQDLADSAAVIAARMFCACMEMPEYDQQGLAAKVASESFCVLHESAKRCGARLASLTIRMPLKSNLEKYTKLCDCPEESSRASTLLCAHYGMEIENRSSTGNGEAIGGAILNACLAHWDENSPGCLVALSRLSLRYPVAVVEAHMDRIMALALAPVCSSVNRRAGIQIFLRFSLAVPFGDVANACRIDAILSFFISKVIRNPDKVVAMDSIPFISRFFPLCDSLDTAHSMLAALRESPCEECRAHFQLCLDSNIAKYLGITKSSMMLL